MKKLTTRMLSIMTTIVMILTMLPLTAFADKTKVQIVNVKRHVKHKKRENPKKAVKKQNTPYKLRIYGVYEV